MHVYLFYTNRKKEPEQLYMTYHLSPREMFINTMVFSRTSVKQMKRLENDGNSNLKKSFSSRE